MGAHNDGVGHNRPKDAWYWYVVYWASLPLLWLCYGIALLYLMVMTVLVRPVSSIKQPPDIDDMRQ